MTMGRENPVQQMLIAQMGSVLQPSAVAEYPGARARNTAVVRTESAGMREMDKSMRPLSTLQTTSAVRGSNSGVVPGAELIVDTPRRPSPAGQPKGQFSVGMRVQVKDDLDFSQESLWGYGTVTALVPIPTHASRTLPLVRPDGWAHAVTFKHILQLRGQQRQKKSVINTDLQHVENALNALTQFQIRTVRRGGPPRDEGNHMACRWETAADGQLKSMMQIRNMGGSGKSPSNVAVEPVGNSALNLMDTNWGKAQVLQPADSSLSTRGNSERTSSISSQGSHAPSARPSDEWIRASATVVDRGSASRNRDLNYALQHQVRDPDTGMQGRAVTDGRCVELSDYFGMPEFEELDIPALFWMNRQ